MLSQFFARILYHLGEHPLDPGDPRETFLGAYPSLSTSGQDLSSVLKPVSERTWSGTDSEAYVTIVVSSILHNTSAPLFFMQLEFFQAMRWYLALPSLAAIWGGAAALNAWVNYHKYSRRLTRDFLLTPEKMTCENKEPGTLNLFVVLADSLPVVTDNHRPTSATTLLELSEEVCYRMSVKDSHGDVVQELVFLKKILSKATHDVILRAIKREGGTLKLNKQQSLELKAAITKDFPHHRPVLLPDASFSPGNQQDNYFFFKCLGSELPTMFSGFLLGSILFSGKSNAEVMAAMFILGVLNYLKNLFSDMPALFDSYGEGGAAKLSAIADQPYVWLALNPPVLWLLKNLAPAINGLLVFYAALALDFLPVFARAMVGFVLYFFQASGFLLFIMQALKQLDPSNPAIGLSNDFTESSNLGFKIMGELLGGQFMTIQLYFSYGKASSSQISAILAVMNAFAALVLIYEPTPSLIRSFFHFFFDNSANDWISPLIYVAYALEILVAIMATRSQYGNFHAAVADIVKNSSPESRSSLESAPTHDVVRFSKNNFDWSGPWKEAGKLPMAGTTIKDPIKEEDFNACKVSQDTYYVTINHGSLFTVKKADAGAAEKPKEPTFYV